jgi:outer membrane protein OmpA-like peptidoglycan-associated protein
MKKFSRNYNDDSTWQAVYMDLITLVMVLFLILWSIQEGGDGAPVETNNVVPFYKVTLKDSSFPDGGTVFGGSERKKLIQYLTKTERDDFTKLGHNRKDDSYYYITVHGHGSLTGTYEQNMNIAMRRAQSVADAVKDAYKSIGTKEFKNKDPNKNDRYMISVCGHSYNFPKAQLDPTLTGKMRGEQQKVNRRVDVMYHKIPGQIMHEYFLKE